MRFHGRGGHGVKTASRILGTAAFLGGLQAQDFPVYGAERRGAAVAAYTRLDPGQICERGVILDPDLILVADETLFEDPTAGVLTGREFASALLVNSPLEAGSIAGRYAIPCPVLALDLTTGLLGRGPVLSAPLGAAACALAGLPLELTERAVREELGELRLPPDVIDGNLEVARRVHARVPAAQLRERPAPAADSPPHAPRYADGWWGAPRIVAAGNAAARHTGTWRVFRPVIDLDACTRCGICFACCPDGAITRDAQGYPVLDYYNCKGCMICLEECPLGCIHEQREVRAW